MKGIVKWYNGKKDLDLFMVQDAIKIIVMKYCQNISYIVARFKERNQKNLIW